MTHFSYITNHLLPAWIWQWNYNFRVWSDLMTNNYEVYNNPYCESPEKECYEWFWASINMDDTMTKKSIENLYQIMNDIATGVVETLPAEEVLSRLNERVNQMED